ncbi:MAG: hypothetical protein GY769_20460, partial [bacterium]|nr:hypothetical protein [bacterium]
SGGDVDQWIYFYDDDDWDDEHFGWKEADERFELSNSLAIQANPVEARIHTLGNGDFRLSTESSSIEFTVDTEASHGTIQRFSWYKHDRQLNNTLMSLNHQGDLSIKGTFSGGGADLAESFWTADELEIGELVVVDPARPDAVVRSSQAYQRSLVGVVSGAPAIVLGGKVGGVAALRRLWGNRVADAFSTRQEALRTALYAERDDLREEAARLVSPGRFASYVMSLEGARTRKTRAGGDDDPSAGRSVRERSPGSLEEVYRQALLDHEERMSGLALERFFEERFVGIALAGRVPVKVDASYGAIEAGDPLTASPNPGVAMRADRASVVVGTALEALARGEGTILMLVDRSWYPGEAVQIAAASETARSELASLRRRNAELTERVDRLSAAVESLTRRADLPEVAGLLVPTEPSR